MDLPRWVKRVGTVLTPGEQLSASSLTIGTIVASMAASGCSAVTRNAKASSAPAMVEQVVDSVVTPFSEKFILTQADSIVVRCDTIRYRRAPAQSRSGSGHQSHASHASHSSHSSHSSGGWV